jgi:hypothetical protein
MEALSISAIVVAIIGALGSLITALHMRKCHIFGTCCESDCTPKSVPPTPKIEEATEV